MKRRRKSAESAEPPETLFDSLERPQEAAGRPHPMPASSKTELDSLKAPALNLTTEQALAADLSCNRVISASAGTGKTHTLTAIYLGLLQAHALRPSQIVAVTFTEKAAHELREQITRKLSKSLQGERLEDCARELAFAPIQTIHGFCTGLLRRAGVRPRVPAGFGILEEEESKELLDRALLETAARQLESDEDPAFHELAREWKVTAGFRFGLVSAGRILAAALRTRGIQPAALMQASNSANVVDELQKILAAALSQAAQEPEKGHAAAKESLRRLKQEPAQIESVSEGRRKILHWLDLGRKSDGKPYAWAQQIEGALLEGLVLAHAPLRLALARYLDMAITRYQQEKLRRAMLDYDDLILEARELLRAEPECVEPYRFVLIDEFQDTNPLQKDVLYRVAFPAGAARQHTQARLTVVGDVKQSIYRFRGADVSLMAEALSSRELQAAPLHENFRSRGEVLDWINSFCSRALWQETSAEVEATGSLPAFRYSSAHVLKASEKQPGRHEWHGPPGELLALDEDLSGGIEERRWQQALTIARRIQTLTQPGSANDSLLRPRIWDKEAQCLRDSVRFGDIAVLARSLKHMRAPLERAFSHYGIPFRMLKGVLFFTRQEVLDVINLLAAVADSADHTALAGLFRSPFVLLSDGALFRLFRESGESLDRRLVEEDASGLEAQDAGRFRASAGLLKRLRAALGLLTAAEIIDTACLESGYLGIQALQPQGEVAVAGVRRLIELTRSFEARGRRTLADLVTWLRKQADAEWSSPEQVTTPDLTPDLPEATDVVRIGTIHSAKGLEFPITILADIGASPAQPQPSALLLAEGAEGADGVRLGLRAGAEREHLQASGDAWHQQAVEANKAAELAESKRLLYVALTRARDYLILAGEAGNQRKESWRAWIDTHAELLEKNRGTPDLTRVSYNHPALPAILPSAASGPIDFSNGLVRLPKMTQDGLDRQGLQRLRSLLDQYAVLPKRAEGKVRTGEVSVTALAHFLSCPRRHAWSAQGGVESAENLRAGDDESPAGGRNPETEPALVSTQARDLGTAAHAALEAAFTSGDARAALPAWRAALASAGSAPQAALSQAFEGSVERVLEGAWAKAVLALPPDRRVAERPFRWRMETPAGHSVNLFGTLDLLAKNGAETSEKWQVVDYKWTASDASKADGSARELLAQYAWQVGIYALAAGKILEAEEAEVLPALLFLRGGAAQPQALAKLPLTPAPPATLPEARLLKALEYWMSAQEALREGGPESMPKAAWPIGAQAPIERNSKRCSSEGCPFVSRCFSVESAQT